MKNYRLNIIAEERAKGSVWGAILGIVPFLSSETWTLVFAFIAILVNSALSLLVPFLMGRAVDIYIIPAHFSGIITYGIIIGMMYLIAFGANYAQLILMGGVGQRTVFKLRNEIFTKLGKLPLAFFNENKAGDLISRINNDTDKLNQFFAQTLTRFVGSLFTILGTAIFIIAINWRLGLLTIIPAGLILIATELTSSWVKKKNAKNLQATGLLSAEIQESLENFKVIVAFNRRDYFRSRFAEANHHNYKAAVSAGLVNNIFQPTYDFADNIATLVILLYGAFLITQGLFTIGLLVAFLVYVDRFYNPLRQLAVLWSSFQLALAAWDRVSDILNLESNLIIKPLPNPPLQGEGTEHTVLSFDHVSFGYNPEKLVLNNISFDLMPGKTYAFVGPTGGGKTTTANLMARLYDPTKGTVYIEGRDIRSYHDHERTQKIGFILQEPFLFGSTLKEAIVYGMHKKLSEHEVLELLKNRGLDHLLKQFEHGLETPISNDGSQMSLGERQIVAFMRAVIREPDVLILDEATANIDTVTEGILDMILKKLPSKTTVVIIAHRLNTIKNADEIFFVNNGTVVQAGTFDRAVEMLLNDKRSS